ncbi:hypothetical protein BJ741DRAFT_597961 [Chytriomyces cf. hyalinus JEL632]|nr:hypothetical protein BJ741DRAFT_597961 [Chytriomyces cf. hyalinus JEL632]
MLRNTTSCPPLDDPASITPPYHLDTCSLTSDNSDLDDQDASVAVPIPASSYLSSLHAAMSNLKLSWDKKKAFKHEDFPATVGSTIKYAAQASLRYDSQQQRWVDNNNNNSNNNNKSIHSINSINNSTATRDSMHTATSSFFQPPPKAADFSTSPPIDCIALDMNSILDAPQKRTQKRSKYVDMLNARNVVSAPTPIRRFSMPAVAPIPTVENLAGISRASSAPVGGVRRSLDGVRNQTGLGPEGRTSFKDARYQSGFRRPSGHGLPPSDI